MNPYIFSASISGFLLGVTLATLSDWVIHIPARFFIASLIILVILSAFSFFLTKKSTGKKASIAVICGFLFLYLGVIRYIQVIADVGDVHIAENVGQKITLQGIIREDPDERQRSTYLILEAQKLIQENQQIALRPTRIRVTVPTHYVLSYGDIVEVYGTLKKPEPFETDTGRVFDYSSYLAKSNIYYTLSAVSLGVVATRQGNPVKSAMLRLKNIFVAQLDSLYPQPEGALLAGVLFGEQAGMPEQLQVFFRRTGIVHIVVLSGFNVTIVAVFIIWILGKVLSPRLSLVFGIVGIILFALLVGAGATVIRASIMAIIAILARLYGSSYQVLRGLFLAGAIMVANNPKILLSDISFQLSFLATLSLILFSDFFNRIFRKIPETLTLRETVTSTFSAQILVLPLILYAMGEFSIVSPIVNVLVVPWVSFTMLIGFLSALVGLMSPVLGMVLMFPNYFILHLQISIVEFFGNFQFASVIVPSFSLQVMILAYVFVFAWAWYLNKKAKNQKNTPP